MSEFLVVLSDEGVDLAGEGDEVGGEGESAEILPGFFLFDFHEF